jgi:hypothetical protein
MTKNDIQIGFNSGEELFDYINNHRGMKYVSIDASELFLLLQANQNKYILLYKLKIVGDLEFDKLEFRQLFMFTNCEITGNVNMENAIFNESFSFTNCKITGNVDMENAIFNNVLLLDDLSYKNFVFSNTTCEDDVVVTQMSGRVLCFGDCEQPSTAKFKKTIYLEECNLGSIFFGSKDISRVPIFDLILIRKSSIKQFLFQHIKPSRIRITESKIDELSCSGITVGRFNLGNNSVIGNFNLLDSTLSDGSFGENNIYALLEDTTIKGSFNMTNCSFLSDINFKNSLFNDVVNFSNTFSTNLKLNDSKFEGILNLNNSKFANGLNLGTSEFKGGLNLGTSQFKKVLDFNNCRIYKSLNWRQACYAGEYGDGIIHHNENFAEATVDRPVARYPVCK